MQLWYRYGDLYLVSYTGDITHARTDAVVNAANSGLWMGAGVAGAIKRAGGAEIEREAVAQGPIEPGEAVITTAGNLPARHVIHAAGMGQDLRTSAELIERSTLSSLRLARDHNLSSIVFPAIGTGVGGFPLDQCARLMTGAARKFYDEQGTPPELVAFALLKEPDAEIFGRALSGFADSIGEPPEEMAKLLG